MRYLFTVGYAGRTVNQLFELLFENDVEQLVDVRLRASGLYGWGKAGGPDSRS